MPPEVSQSQYRPLITHTTQSLARLSPKSKLRHRRYMQICLQKMKISKTKLVPLLVFCFSIASILCFLKITEIAYSPQHPLAVLNVSDHRHYKNLSRDDTATNLTEKETKFLLEFFSKRKPCNLLVFGHEDLYSTLNSGGLTLLLDESPNRSSAAQSSNGSVQAHQIGFDTVASRAYDLLKEARENTDCKPTEPYELEGSRCSLLLRNVPEQVYGTEWDVILIDGPSGDSVDSHGRMASIYTSAVLARRMGRYGDDGNVVTDVFVHDVERRIEKWFSWEFMCEENLVSSKGRFWHFRIKRAANATTFCTR